MNYYISIGKLVIAIRNAIRRIKWSNKNTSNAIFVIIFNFFCTTKKKTKNRWKIVTISNQTYFHAAKTISNK